MNTYIGGLLRDCETSIFSKVCFQLYYRLRLHWLHSLPVIPGPGLHQPCLSLWKPGVGSFAKMTLVLWTPIVRARAFVTRMEWIRVFAISSLSRKYLLRPAENIYCTQTARGCTLLAGCLWHGVAGRDLMSRYWRWPGDETQLKYFYQPWAEQLRALLSTCRGRGDGTTLSKCEWYCKILRVSVQMI